MTSLHKDSSLHVTVRLVSWQRPKHQSDLDHDSVSLMWTSDMHCGVSNISIRLTPRKRHTCQRQTSPSTSQRQICTTTYQNVIRLAPGRIKRQRQSSARNSSPIMTIQFVNMACLETNQAPFVPLNLTFAVLKRILVWNDFVIKGLRVILVKIRPRFPSYLTRKQMRSWFQGKDEVDKLLKPHLVCPVRGGLKVRSRAVSRTYFS